MAVLYHNLLEPAHEDGALLALDHGVLDPTGNFQKEQVLQELGQMVLGQMVPTHAGL